MSASNQKGFTLIELLVVISIIAVLSVIGLVAYGNVLKSSRDAKRQSDLKFIQSALEEYHADQIYYPDSLPSPGTAFVFGTKTYLNQIPADPKPPPAYSYVAFPTRCNNTTTKCTSYCLNAKMESTLTNTTCSTLGYNYGVTRP